MQLPDYTFSGHETFQCRQFWLKKGFDFVKAGKSFNDESAVIDLGVGKNMVTSIRYWLKAFNILMPDDKPSDWADLLLADGGWDPFLEDEASIWLLHYHLVSRGYASIYSLIFNEFRKEKVEFTRENYCSYLSRKAETDRKISFNENTTKSDFDTFVKLYTYNEEDSIEDKYTGLFNDLGLLTYLYRDREKNKEKTDPNDKAKKFYNIENKERLELPAAIFLYSILNKKEYTTSINLLSLEHDDNGPCTVFAMNRAGILLKISECTELYNDIIFTDNAGVKELQFKRKLSPINILKEYYEN